MYQEPDIQLIIKRLHLLVDGLETTLAWALETNGYPVVRLTFSGGGHEAYTLVVGVEEPASRDEGEG